MVLLDHLINEIKRRNHHVGSEDISLNDHGSGFHLGLGGCDALICPLPDPALRAAWRHKSKNKYKEIDAQKKMPQQLEPISLQKKFGIMTAEN